MGGLWIKGQHALAPAVSLERLKGSIYRTKRGYGSTGPDWRKVYMGGVSVHQKSLGMWVFGKDCKNRNLKTHHTK